MKTIVTLIALVIASASFNASAITLHQYKASSSKIVKKSDAEVNKIWESSTPACIKDGSKLLGVNKAFVEKRLGYSDCSTSDNAKEKQTLLGYNVEVIRLTSLSPAMAKQVKGIN